MGMTKGDKLYFEGAESFYQVTGRRKLSGVKDPQALELKRKLAPAESPPNVKRHHRSHQ
jgi:hypothetical protein